LPYTAHAAAAARAHLRRQTRQLPPATLDDALLLTSELVTNAIRHGRPEVTLVVALAPSALTVIVTDTSPDLPPVVPRNPHPDSLTGRGLVIVDALADQWGITPQPARPGKAVWFALHLP
jgi:anti-sigma regulatory factor (Ser/Thr protein kinase)